MKEQGGRLDYFLRVPGIIATSSLIRIRVNNDALEPSLSFFAEKGSYARVAEGRWLPPSLFL
jgi:hypothetical protein